MFESGSEGRTAQQCAVLTRLLSPLMCNVYLHRLDRAWDERDGVLVRFADDRAPRARLEVAM